MSLTACGDDNDSGSGSEVTFVVPTPVMSMSLLAVVLPAALGTYEEQGVDVNFEFVQGGAPALQQLASGNADFAWIGSAGLLPAFSQGHDLETVYDTFAKRWLELRVLEDSPITSLEDLKGKTIGGAPTRGGYPEIVGLLAERGLEVNKDYQWVTVPSTNPKEIEKALKDGTFDAFSTTITDLALQAAVTPDTAFRDILPPEAAGVVAPNAVVATRRDFAEDEKEKVTKILTAITAGMVAARCDSEAALAAMKKYAPTLFNDADAARVQFEVTLDHLVPEDLAADHMFGNQDLAGWEAMLKRALLAPEATGVTKDVDLSKHVNNDFVEAVASSKAVADAGCS